MSKRKHQPFRQLFSFSNRLLGPLETYGYILPKKMMPDIALGLMFSKWLRDSGRDPDSFPTYRHEFLDRRPTVDARLYLNDVITGFNEQLDNWLRDGRAQKYFSKNDPNSIEPLSKVLALPPPVTQSNPE